jgi:hypothetical protein
MTYSGLVQVIRLNHSARLTWKLCRVCVIIFSYFWRFKNIKITKSSGCRIGSQVRGTGSTLTNYLLKGVVYCESKPHMMKGLVNDAQRPQSSQSILLLKRFLSFNNTPIVFPLSFNVSCQDGHVLLNHPEFCRHIYTHLTTHFTDNVGLKTDIESVPPGRNRPR